MYSRKYIILRLYLKQQLTLKYGIQPSTISKLIFLFFHPFFREATVFGLRLEKKRQQHFFCLWTSLSLSLQSLPPITRGPHKINTHFLFLSRVRGQTDFLIHGTKVDLYLSCASFPKQLSRVFKDILNCSTKSKLGNFCLKSAPGSYACQHYP